MSLSDLIVCLITWRCCEYLNRSGMFLWIWLTEVIVKCLLLFLFLFFSWVNFYHSFPWLYVVDLSWLLFSFLAHMKLPYPMSYWDSCMYFIYVSSVILINGTLMWQLWHCGNFFLHHSSDVIQSMMPSNLPWCFTANPGIMFIGIHFYPHNNVCVKHKSWCQACYQAYFTAPGCFPF